MRSAVSALLFIIVANTANGDIFSYDHCDESGTSHYGGHVTRGTPKCAVCNTPTACERPNSLKCTPEVVDATLANISQILPNAKIEVKPSKRLVCFALQASNLNNANYDIRGCMYYQTIEWNEPILSYIFDYGPMYGKVYKECKGSLIEVYARRETILKYYSINFENYNRTYWNNTHFPKVSCLQCPHDNCNKVVSVYGRIGFQRQVRGTKTWDNCLKYGEKNKDEFKKQCLRDKTVGSADSFTYIDRPKYYKCGDEWNWPEVIFVPLVKHAKLWWDPDDPRLEKNSTKDQT